MLIAGVALAVYFRIVGFDAQWRRWWPQYSIVGLLPPRCRSLVRLCRAQPACRAMSVINASSPMCPRLSGGAARAALCARHRRLGSHAGVASSPPEASARSPPAGAAATGAAVATASPAPAEALGEGCPSRHGARHESPARRCSRRCPRRAPTAADALVAACLLAMGPVCGAVAHLLFRLVTDTRRRAYRSPI
jgi:hypothetical protein